MSPGKNPDGNREQAAALGVAIALTLAANEAPAPPSAGRKANAWRAAGRIDQFLARSITKGGWR